MPIRLNGATSGYTQLEAADAANDNTLKLPAGNGTNGELLGSDGAGNLIWVKGRMELSTAKAYNWNGSTTNTSIDFTGIPSWAKRVTLLLAGVSSSGTQGWLVQLGVGTAPTTSGYANAQSTLIYNTASGVSQTSTAGFPLFYNLAASIYSGRIVLENITGNLWLATGIHGASVNPLGAALSTGNVTLSGALGIVRLTTANGADTFDAGTINLLIEG